MLKAKSLQDFISSFQGAKVYTTEAGSNPSVLEITSDSRKVKPGSLFFAISGTQSDGRKFIPEVLSRGALAVVGEDLDRSLFQNGGVAIEVRDAREALSAAASVWFDFPSKKLKIVGVTGTSGKTTTTYLIESVCKAAGFRTAAIGTVSVRFPEKEIESTHTTPGAFEVQEILHQALQEGCTHVVMEVSSHALKQRRVEHVEFDVEVFTNLSREHLDYHPDMEDYFAAKRHLFFKPNSKARRAIVNSADEFGRQLAKELHEREPSVLKTFAGASALVINEKGISGHIGEAGFCSPLIGHFNGENIAAAIESGLALGFTPQQVAHGIEVLKGIPGRLEEVHEESKGGGGGPRIFVDYAHKPDALEKVLHVLNPLKGRGRLISVFGCGGDRDRTKRPVMGKLASMLSDHVFLTSDNPRTEDPSAILSEVLRGVDPDRRNRVTVEPDRKKAILEAVHGATAGDWILIAGKGHETYQIIGTEKKPFDDRAIAAEALKLKLTRA